jgi:hypothetical protein
MIQKGLQEMGDEFVKRLKEQFDKKGLNDTGKGQDSLEATTKENKLLIWGLARVLFLEYGRKPGTFPPVDVIQEWVERKLNVGPEESKGVAFVIARKIANEGTNIFRDKAKGLQVELILQDLYDDLSKVVLDFKTQEITGGLIKNWK